jgi:hypothetical protein
MKRAEPRSDFEGVKDAAAEQEEKDEGAKIKERPQIPRSASTPPGKAGGFVRAGGRARFGRGPPATAA